MKVKICGLTNYEDAKLACDFGADYVGFLFAEESPRYVDSSIVKDISAKLPDKVLRVGLFKDEDLQTVISKSLECSLDCVQLHGSESPDFCSEIKRILSDMGKTLEILKTFKVSDKVIGSNIGEYEEADYLLFDTYHPGMMGGTGLTFNWGALSGVKSDKPFFLAGGLTPENVREAVKQTNPFGVDISSGVEISVGKKDPEKLKEFIRNAKKI